jgi:hypothetical protein
VLIERNGDAPRGHASAQIAPSATIVGNVLIGARAYVDHAAVIASGGLTSDGFLRTADVERAREAVTAIDFETVFGAHEDDQPSLHAQVIATLFDEVHAWQDEPLGHPEREG